MLHHTKSLFLMNSESILREDRACCLPPFGIDECLDVWSIWTRPLLNHSGPDFLKYIIHNIKGIMRVSVAVTLIHEINLESMKLIEVTCLGRNSVLIDLANDVIGGKKMGNISIDAPTLHV